MPLYTGAKWGDSAAFGTSGDSVTYSFALPTTPSYYDFSAQLSAEYQGVVTGALAEWSSYADISFVYTSDSNSADILVGWGDIDGANDILAECAFSYSYSGLLLWAEVIFDVAEFWAPTTEQTDSNEVSFETVALHELGHAIGLDHHNDQLSIMNPSYGGTLELTGYDVSAIQTLYGPAPAAQPSYGWAWGDSFDFGGWNYGWHSVGSWYHGWHYESGWDYGAYQTPSGASSSGWFFHEGYEYGWYQWGWTSNGWYYDYGGTGVGWNLGSPEGGTYGQEGASQPSLPSAYGSGYGPAIDYGGWQYGWFLDGMLDWGWHYEVGWDYGWYSDGWSWYFGWSYHAGSEYGWFSKGSWSYGWYYDYGGTGWSWNQGYAWGGYQGDEY